MWDVSHQISAVFGVFISLKCGWMSQYCHKYLCGESHILVFYHVFHISNLHVTISNLLSGVCCDCIPSVGF